MPIPVTSLVRGEGQLNEMKTALMSRLMQLKQFWLPLNLRQDYWLNMYRLLDVLQMAKPLGVARRFTSNEPRTGVDAAKAILTRNPTIWRIPLKGAEDENQEMRRRVGKIERTLEGLVYDIDELNAERLQQPFWKTVVDQALLRGMVWGKFHITTEALKYRHSPMVTEIFDSRLVYPHIDQWGLNHVIIEKPTNLGDLVATYPAAYGDLKSKPNFNPNQKAVKIEFWSNDRPGVKGVHMVLASIGVDIQASGYIGLAHTGTAVADTRWVIPPFYHGYTYDELPVVGVPVNGVHMTHSPSIIGPLADRLLDGPDLAAMASSAWRGPNSWVAEIGRSILSSVEEQVPQYNELIATIFQHLSINTYGTWIFKTPTGEMPNFEPGIESKVVLTPGESVERVNVEPLTQDAYRLMDILSEERQKGILSNVLQAVTPNLASGALLQQITNAALSSLEPFQQGLRTFGTRMGTSTLAQLQKAAPALGMFELGSTPSHKSFFNIEFDPTTDLDMGRRYRPVPVMKPALPDDLTVRMTAARMALDPRRPMLSLMTVMEDILFVDDPAAESDRIWEDLAQNDPVIILEQMAQAMERHNEPEMAARMRDVEFATRFVEEQKLRQLTGGAQQGAPPGAAPTAGGPLSGGGRDGTEQQQPAGAEGLGALGERVGV
jgi:hypothetical protein